MTSPIRRMLVLAACCLSACTVSDSTPAADAAKAAAAAKTAIPSTSSAILPPGSSGSSAAATPPAAPAAGGGTVAFDAVPPLRVGMSANDARRALGIPAVAVSKTGDSCSYLDVNGKSSAFVMMENDTIVRFEARDKSLATAAGARIGDTEASVLARYAGRVTVQKHKYLPTGHYLIVTTPTNAALRLVFETDGTQVTTFRVGRRPAVEYVEGCG